VVLITHRTSAINITSKLLMLRDGVAQMFGPTAQVLADIAKATQQPAHPARPAALTAVRNSKPDEAGTRQAAEH
jgi:ATP-binding cassette, subfamily C, bacterial exporter for protease/lipase